MKKFVSIPLCALFVSFLTCGVALSQSIPFQIDGSDLTVTWTKGGGLVDYKDYAMTEPIALEKGEYFDYKFGQIFFPLAFGKGTAKIGVDFEMPVVDASAGGTGNFKVFSVFFISSGDLIFDSAQSFSYSYGGNGGGLVTLAFDNIKGIQCGSWVDITGTVTNSNAPAPVPEPATMILFGTGLVGLVGVVKRKKK